MAYPRSRNKLHLQELRRFTISLGMPRDSLVKFLKPVGEKNDEVYYSVSLINELLDNKTANRVLHRTFNVYSAEYNTRVIRKALNLVMNRRLTFEELHEVRSLFEAYESEDVEGMSANEHTIFRILKHCGRSIAPLKLQHKLKKMKDEVDTFGRLQLYEFLDIIPYTTYIKQIEVPMKLYGGTAKDQQQLYKIDNFHTFLFTHDEKVRNKLDKDYRHIISCSIYSEEGPKLATSYQKMIQNDKQDALEAESKKSYKDIKDALRHSNNVLSMSKGGQLLKSTSRKQSLLLKSRLNTAPVSTADTLELPICKAKLLLDPLISEKDMEKQSALIEDLEWEMINNAEKYKNSVDKKIEELKTKKKYREARNLYSQPGSVATRRTTDMFAIRPSRPSTVTDPFDFYSTFEEDLSFRTKASSSGSVDLEGEETESVSDDPGFRDITLDEGYKVRKQLLLEKVKLIKEGNRLVDF